MKFIKLLDPRGLTPAGPGLTIAEQALRARQMFPQLVNEAHMSYWRTGDPLVDRGIRLLIGLAPTFSLPDLRFADLLSETLASHQHYDVTVEVFDVDDLQQGRLVPVYFPGCKGIPSTPVVGMWNDGQFMGVRFGADAMNFVCQQFRIAETAESIVRSIRPPSDALLDG